MVATIRAGVVVWAIVAAFASPSWLFGQADTPAPAERPDATRDTAPKPSVVIPPENTEAPPHIQTLVVDPPESEGMAGGGRSGGFGGGMGGMWAGSVFGHMSPRASYQVTWLPEEHVKGQPTDLGFWRHDFAAAYPLWQDDENEWSTSAGVRAEFLHTGAVLPNTGQPFPDELWNVRVGVGYRHLFENGWIAGTNVSLGSASDQPFHSLDEADVSASAFLRVPQGERNAWIFSLSFSTNSQVLNYIPIPGVAYFWNPSPSFQATIGFPFANILWRPTEEWSVQVSYALLTNVHGRIGYRLAPGVQAYLGYGAGSESYYLADRTDSRDRFFYNDQRVFGGIQWRFLRQWSADLSGGYAFDRSYFEGHNYGRSTQDQVGVENAPFVSFKIQTRF